MTRWLMVVVLGACGRPTPPAPAPVAAQAPDAGPRANRDRGQPTELAVLGWFGDDRELAVLRWTERDELGVCLRDYAVALKDLATGTERVVALETLPCPRSWWRCGPTPRCEPGMIERTDWRVTLEGTFPVDASGRHGLMVRVAEPDGDVVRFYDVARAERWHFGTRRVDHVFVTASRVEILVCEDLEPVRVLGILDGRIVEYPEPPTVGVTCSELGGELGGTESKKQIPRRNLSF